MFRQVSRGRTIKLHYINVTAIDSYLVSTLILEVGSRASDWTNRHRTARHRRTAADWTQLLAGTGWGEHRRTEREVN